MRNFIYFIIACIIFSSCQTSAERDQEIRKKTFERIDKKYADLGFTGINEVYKLTKQIPIYSKVLNEKQNKFDEKQAQISSDSILNSFFKSINITEEEFKRDIDSVNTTRTYVKNYLEHNYNMLYDDRNLKMGFYQAFKNNPKIDFLSASEQYSSFHFKKEEKSETKFISNLSVENWMSDYDGSIKDFKESVIHSLHDPESFEHVETSYNDKDVNVKVRMKFRAKNKFGAKVLNQADAILNIANGTVSNIKISQ